ncbi:FAD-dependent monooxygenase [Actinomadura sp. SCN-SB]|uniref:FAD-dependent monooxygenase n=1 Tax=Actinomadura sp. SCN-SB TaxID=3373092 RepID=UPI003750755A
MAGGGIGGLAAALGLTRSGWRVTLMEQAPRFEPAGAGLSLAPNAVRALDWLGLGDVLRSQGMIHGAAGIRGTSGRWLMRTRIEELEERFGAPAIAIHRADLHDLLVAADDAAALRLGHQVTSVRTDRDSANVTYRGPEGIGSDTADVVVAADGLHSQARSVLFPEHPGPAYAGYITWRGVVPSQTLPTVRPAAAVTETWGRGHRFGIVPLVDDQIYWFATASLPEGSHTEDDLNDLAVRYAGWHDPIPAVLDATPPEALLRHDICHLETPLPRYASGRIALVGDAAHAMTPDLGEGAGLAIEDAVTLSAALARATSPAEVTAALAAYDRARRPRTQKLVRISARYGRIAQWRNPLAVAVRDTLATLVPPSGYLRATTEALSWEPPRSQV